MATVVSDVVDADGVAAAMVYAMAVHVAIIAIATPMSNIWLKGFKDLDAVMVHKKPAASASTLKRPVAATLTLKRPAAATELSQRSAAATAILKRPAAATMILERLVVAVCGQ